MMRLLARPGVLALLFLLCALPTGLGCALLTPVGAFSDESEHCARADGLRHGEIFGQTPPPELAGFWINAGVNIDNGMRGVLFSKELDDARPGRAVTAADRQDIDALPWFAGTAYYPTQMAAYFPIMYVPAAAGLLAGQEIGLSPVRDFYAGRVCMLLAFVGLGTAAIGLARCGNGVMFAVLTLPSAINLASSYNQDGLIIACCALAAALLSRAGAGVGRVWLAALALLTAVVSAKTPYAALLLICLPPFLAPFLARGVKQRVLCIWLAGILPGLWLLHSVHGSFIDYQVPPYHPGPLWPGGRDVWLHDMSPRNNIRVLLAQPWQLVLLPVGSFIRGWQNFWPLLLGSISYGNQYVAGWEYPCLAAALLAAASGAVYGRGGVWGRADAAWTGVALFVAFIGVELSLYLTWTRAGAGSIVGFAPRYVLPLLPFFVLLLPQGGARRVQPGWFCLPAVMLAVVNVFAVPAAVVQLFSAAGK
jgi:hypothetical protein